MKSIPRSSALLLLAAMSAPAFAQQVPATFTPNPAFQGTNVRMQFSTFVNGCGAPQVTAVTRTGGAIRVDYRLVPVPGFVCIGTPPPVTDIALDLGGFPPGQYVVTAFGLTEANQAIQPVSGPLGILAAANVPSGSTISSLLLVLAAAVAGGVALARRRAASV